MVRAGQPLLVVGDVRNDAELSLLQDQLRAERIRNARAAAEAALGREVRRAGRSCRRAGRERPLRARDRAVPGAAPHARRADRLAGSADARCARAGGGADEADRGDRSLREARGGGAGDQREARAPGIRAARAAAAAAARRGGLSQPPWRSAERPRARRSSASGELQARIAQARNQYQQPATDETTESAANPRARGACAARRRTRPNASSCARRSMAESWRCACRPSATSSARAIRSSTSCRRRKSSSSRRAFGRRTSITCARARPRKCA